jgi:hypothetical protein
MMQQILDKIAEIMALAVSLKERVEDLIANQTTAEIEINQQIVESDGSNVILFVIPSNAQVIGYVLRDLEFNFATRGIKVTNIAKKIVGADLHVNLFLSQPAHELAYRGKISYTTPAP